MVAAVTALVLLRLEAEGDAAREASALLTEIFVADMDASLRQIGIGDYVVGKHIGRLMGALGGRLGALREAGDRGLEAFAAHNVFHDSPPSDEATKRVAARLEQIRAALREPPLDALLAGRVAAPCARRSSAVRSESTRSAPSRGRWPSRPRKRSARRWRGASASSRSTGSRPTRRWCATAGT